MDPQDPPRFEVVRALFGQFHARLRRQPDMEARLKFCGEIELRLEQLDWILSRVVAIQAGGRLAGS